MAKKIEPNTRDRQTIIFFGVLLLYLTCFLRTPNNPVSNINQRITNEEDSTYIEVSGEIKKPGIYNMHGEFTILDVISKTGGLKHGMSIDMIPRTAGLKGGDKINITTAQKHTIAVSVGRMAPEKLIILSIPMDINTATLEDLTKIPGLGPGIARGIINYRNKNGGFFTMEELERVKGIGKAKYKRINEYLVIDKGGEI